MNFTPLARPYFTAIHRSLTKEKMHPDTSQEHLLKRLLHDAARTETGRRRQEMILTGRVMLLCLLLVQRYLQVF